jgi:hypothetical protein
MTMRLTGTFVLVLSVLVFAGGAYAGNGNGNENGNGNGKGTETQGDAPGNSASAPGQVKKDAPPPAAETTTSAVTTTTAPTTTASETNADGVKPSNSTAHDTHAEAQSDKTKQYGNGQTAGQVAEQNGAAGNAVLHGPGNSQPHKLAPCSGRHEVDVHALKNHHGGSCGGPTPQPQPHPQPDPGPPPAVTTTTTTTTTTTATTATTATTEQKRQHPDDPGSKPAAGDPAGSESAGGVVSSPGRTRQTEGVLSATQRIGHVATLPFTGQRLWIVALVGLILIATGLALREIRTAEAPVESEHDHTDRSRHAARSSGASVGRRPGR